MDEPTAETAVEPEAAHAAEGDVPRPRRRWARRIGLGLAGTVAVLALAALALYRFGGMERPSDETRAAYAALVSAGRAAPIESRFVIRVPGCRCHHDDPVVAMQHSTRRMNECFASGCHGR